MPLLSHMCPKCDYYMPLVSVTVTEKEEEKQVFQRQCRNCGHAQAEAAGLVMKMMIQEKASEAFQLILNEFTTDDPRLPHVETLPCPNESCQTNTAGAKKDVIYMKYDAENMKFLYICTVCKTKWRSG